MWQYIKRCTKKIKPFTRLQTGRQHLARMKFHMISVLVRPFHVILTICYCYFLGFFRCSYSWWQEQQNQVKAVKNVSSFWRDFYRWTVLAVIPPCFGTQHLRVHPSTFNNNHKPRLHRRPITRLLLPLIIRPRQPHITHHQLRRLTTLHLHTTILHRHHHQLMVNQLTYKCHQSTNHLHRLTFRSRIIISSSLRHRTNLHLCHSTCSEIKTRSLVYRMKNAQVANVKIHH